MPHIKRLRIFAGPNGSGKSTFINAIKKKPPLNSFKLGYYINADDIEQEFKLSKVLCLDQFGIKISTKEIQEYFKKSTFAPVKLEKPNLFENFSVENNCIRIERGFKMNSYIAADLAEFIRQKMLKYNYSFSYETVMSDDKKIDFLKKAKKEGYRIYLYYFATNDPLININRVKVRVALKGHSVNKEAIEKRYYKSLSHLKSAIKLSNRAYLFDNSKKEIELYSEITEGKSVKLVDKKNIPNWFWKYVVGV